MSTNPVQSRTEGLNVLVGVSEKIAGDALEWSKTVGNVPSLVTSATQRIIDIVGVALSAGDLPNVRAASRLTHVFGDGESLAIPTDTHLSAAGAAFLNGIAAHSLELDDYSELAVSHPGTVVIPACLAVAQSRDLDGPSLLRGVIVGYEVFESLANLIVPGSIHQRGFHATSIMGPLAAAVGCTVMLPEPSEEQIVSAIGIAASTSAGLLAFTEDASWTKRFHPGWAAVGGLVSAELAEQGFRGPATAIGGQYGLIRAFGAPADDDGNALNGRGNSFGTVGSMTAKARWGVEVAAYKMYACCGYNHAAITATLDLFREFPDLLPENIASIRVGLFSEAFQMIVNPEEIKRQPRNSVDAQFSIFHAVAVAVASRQAGINQFTDEAATSDALVSLRSRVTVIHDEEVQKHYPHAYGARVNVQTVDGKEFERLCLSPYGSQDNPPSADALDEKFLFGARTLLGPNRAVEALSGLHLLARSPSVRRTFDWSSPR